MHNRKVFVAKDINYASSKTSTTENTATNPADLADGAIGIYGIMDSGATNLNKLVLITDGGSESAGKVPAASFTGSEIFVAVGTPSGNPQLSNPVQLKTGLKSTKAGKYSAPVRGEVRIGYNGTAGSSLNLPSTILRGDNFQVGLFNKNYFVSGGREPGQKVSLSVATALGDSAYTILKKWVAAVNLRTDDILIDKAKIKILHNGTGAVFTTSATVAAVNGATTLTTSAAHGVTAGDAISLGGDYYLTVTGTTGSTLVLDRPYQGATATIANADTLDITGAATQFGLALVDQKDFYNISASVQGIAQDATIKYQTSPTPGSGSYAEVVFLEEEARPKKGTEDMLITYMKRDTIKAVSTATYDLYVLTIQNDQHPRGGQGAVFNVVNYLTLAFVSGVADTAGKNQSDFEDAMTSLFTTFPAISA